MGIGIKELLVILAIIVLLFGTKKLKNLGSDLGAAVKGFRNSVGEPESTLDHAAGSNMDSTATPIDGENSRRTT